MKLILSGGGSGEQVKSSYKKYIDLLDMEKPVLYIPLAWEKNNYDMCLEWLKGELTPFGINKYKVLGDVKEFDNINLHDYNSLFIGGGNTYKLLNYLKNSKGFELIKKYIENDGVVFGGSAGAIIFGKDIKSCNICSEDENLWEDLDTTGFDVCDGKSIACHYGEEGKFEEHDKQIKIYEEKGFKLLLLTEEQSLYINEGVSKIIDDKNIQFN